ncbi:hypothetical protein [Bradyrhizobium erythrophlei]|uniref:hypothetical protein n=1 Tax=Bradyrhizobium erythrophlei TaxID=1437360 RepID=UPI0012AC4EF7|nr:hypothetical protein [Bradyrhizobium erythrophlei]
MTNHEAIGSWGWRNSRFKPSTTKGEDSKAAIASEAKQSIVQQERKLDCFASLAMTVSEHAHKSDCVDGVTGRRSARQTSRSNGGLRFR